jgi:DNA-binding CsgD family transcriptional regulator
LTAISFDPLWVPISERATLPVPAAARGAKLGDRLTTRELQVLALLADGLSDQQLARRLRISLFTEKHHVSAIRVKLGSLSRAHSVHLAHSRGLLGSSPGPTYEDGYRAGVRAAMEACGALMSDE